MKSICGALLYTYVAAISIDSANKGKEAAGKQTTGSNFLSEVSITKPLEGTDFNLADVSISKPFEGTGVNLADVSVKPL